MNSHNNNNNMVSASTTIKMPSSVLLLLLLLPAFVTSSPPSITQHPIDIQVVRNEPVTLDCRADGAPAPLIEWFRGEEGKPVKTAPADPESHRMQLPDGSLFFLAAKQGKKEQDAGVYWCVASNSEGVVRSRNATLSVAYLREEFRAAPEDTDVVVGSDAVLECSAPKGHPEPVVKWKKDGENIELTSASRIRIDEAGNLVIRKAEKADQGRYQCSAENVAALRVSRPIKVRVNELPTLLTRPRPQSVLAGSSVLLECQALGDPHPDIEWTKEEGEIDLSKAKIVHGKGIRLENVHPSDEGNYACTASNAAGSVAAKARLIVSEMPVISVRPEETVIIEEEMDISLNCLSAGKPRPLTFWTREGSTNEIFFGNSGNRIGVTEDGTLHINNPSATDAGKYSCMTVNEVGSAMARSNLIVEGMEEDMEEDMEMSEARQALLSTEIKLESAVAAGATSVKLNWSVTRGGQHRFLSGFRVFYYKKGELRSVEVAHPQVTSFALSGLDKDSEYRVFVQPFFGRSSTAVGIPSAAIVVRTREDKPESAPVIVAAKVLNDTTVYLAWDGVDEDSANGKLLGYEILIQGNGTSVNNSVLPNAREVTLFVSGMAVNRIYTIRIAAKNAQGRGPYSDPLEIELESSSNNNNIVRQQQQLDNNLIWVIAAVATMSFILILLSAVFICKRINKSSSSSSSGYLESAACQEEQEDFLRFSHPPPHLARQVRDANLWIDETRWKKNEEIESNSSEKKLLPHSNSNSDTEYTYVAVGGGGGGGPYASADIFNSVFRRQQQQQQPPQRVNHYATPIFVGGGRRNNFSCDDLRRNNRNQQQQSRLKHSRTMNNNNSSRGQQQQPIANLLDLLPPPPPTAPPPPPTMHVSQESVISPKYLFQHPVYMDCGGSNGGNSSYYRQQMLSAASKDIDRELEEELHSFNEAITKFDSSSASCDADRESEEEDD